MTSPKDDGQAHQISVTRPVFEYLGKLLRCIVHKVVHPLSEGAKRLGERISVSLSGNSGVRARSKYSRRWRHIGSRRIRAMKKLDESKARWIIAQKRKGMTNARIAETMCISVRWVKKISARYSTIDADKIVYPMPMGRPRDSMPGRREHSAVLTARRENHVGAVRLHRRIEESTGMNIPYNRIHRILRDEDLASEQPKKSKRRKWIRFERTYSNSMWHTDYKQLDNGRWFLCYEDDASRFVTGYGVFEHATTENALAVLEEAIKNHGKPASIMTDRGSQFYANASEAKKKGVSEFEKRLVSLGIRQILAGVRHPQTNGKLERLHGELQRKLPEFEAIMMRKSDPVDLFMRWYNHERPHMSLGRGGEETPAEAFVRKMPPRGEIVVDEQTGEEYRAE